MYQWLQVLLRCFGEKKKNSLQKLTFICTHKMFKYKGNHFFFKRPIKSYRGTRTHRMQQLLHENNNNNKKTQKQAYYVFFFFLNLVIILKGASIY